MRIIDKEILKKIAETAQDFGLKELFLFGSVLREDFNDNSDIDIMVAFKEGLHISYFDLCALSERLEGIFNRKVDLIEKNALVNPYRRQEILNTARRIYAN